MPTKPKRKTGRRRTIKKKSPVDVRSQMDIPDFLKVLTKKPLTFVMVYADWCGHCHTLMPHFDNAARNPNNTVECAKINETMLSEVNTRMNNSGNPISVQGYPTVIAVNAKGPVFPIEPINPATLSSLMINTGNIAKNAQNRVKNSMNSINSQKNSTKYTLENVGLEKKGLVNSYSSNSYNPDISNYIPEKAKSVRVKRSKSLKSVKKYQDEKTADDIMSMRPISQIEYNENEPLTPVEPPESYNEKRYNQIIGGSRGSRGSLGGRSLMSSMAKNAYSLAPMNVLMNSKIMKKYSKKSKKKH